MNCLESPRVIHTFYLRGGKADQFGEFHCVGVQHFLCFLQE